MGWTGGWKAISFLNVNDKLADALPPARSETAQRTRMAQTSAALVAGQERAKTGQFGQLALAQVGGQKSRLRDSADRRCPEGVVGDFPGAHPRRQIRRGERERSVAVGPGEWTSIGSRCRCRRTRNSGQ